MKFYTRTGRVATINADIEAARRIFDASVKGLELIAPPTSSNKKPRAEDKHPREDQHQTTNVSSVDLDARFAEEEQKTGEESRSKSPHPFRPVPDGDFELVPLGENPDKAVKIGKGIPDLPRKQLIACLRANADLFAWSAAEMPGLDPEVACHHLSINPAAKAVVQRRRRQSPEKAEAAEKAVKDLLEANFISEAKYSTWLSNVVLVKKSNGKWRMCVDYTDVNRACPKDAYPLPNIDRLVDNSAGYKLLSFMDSYSGYNQIPMARSDKQYTAFMTESGNYYYNVMPFGLKNAGSTYQRMMNKVFQGEIGDTLEVYMDDMIVKSRGDTDHTSHLERYESRKALKAQALADFVAEMTSITDSPYATKDKWTIYVDGASSSSGSGAGIILENGEGLIIEVSLVLSFNTSNNQAEYEALLAGLRLAEDIGAREVKIYTDSQLVASHISGEYQAKNDVLAEYLTLVKDKMKKFAKAEVEHIPREHNSRADILSKLASTRKKGGNKSVIQEILPRSSVGENARAPQIFAIGDDQCWMTPVYNFLTKDELPADAKEASTIKRRACSYTILENKLYRRGFSIASLNASTPRKH
ncbi:uncharacterized protein LOC131659686 [Vicia villosa]|uniref:uncharacterized protein LOC131659686 n=1 Tax=Vicia villosa TaxID=3911 RepID=UPI00273CDBD8|nr:uncharacterized protein LOC131659686 [Vicia villosa]